MSRYPIDPESFIDEVLRFERSAFRLELQDRYAVDEETELYRAFLRGERPSPAATVPAFKEWYGRILDHVRAGRSVERVRVQQSPPTDYQRFERWLDQWNTDAGERIRYMTRLRAYEVGLLPDAGDTDWWLLDDARLIVMHFDGDGHQVQTELVFDDEMVRRACEWRDLALRHSDRHGT